MVTELQGIIGFEGLGINAWLVWILPFVGASLMPAIAKAGKRVRDYAAVGFALASAISAVTLLPLGIHGGQIHSQINWIPMLNIHAGTLADSLSILMANIVAWISLLIFIYSIGYMHGDRNLTRYWFFMLFFIGSMQLIVLSDNLLMVFFGWEGVGLASFALISFWYQDKKKDFVGTPGHYAGGIQMWASPSHAGLKAFLMTKAGDIMMLSGMFLIFGYAGTFGFTELLQDQSWATEMANNNLLVPAAVLIFGGAIGKSAQFPLNEWLLEAMTGPTPVSALIHAATMVKAGVFLVARIGPLFFAVSALNSSQFFEVIAWVGAITAFLLATQALVNPEIKKVLAYSTGSQIGLMMMALGVAGLSSSFVDGYTSGFFHLMSHAMFKASLFMGAGAVLHAVGSRFMTDMGGIRGKMKKTFLFMMMAGLSLAAAPFITSGFWSKDAIIASVLESGYQYSWALFAIAIIVSFMTAFYTFRMLGMTFFGNKSKFIQENESNHHVHEVGAIMWVPFAILAIASIAVGLIGFAFEHQLHEMFSLYLENSFGIHTASLAAHDVLPQASSGFEAFEGLNPIAVTASVAAFALGAILGGLVYMKKVISPEIVSKSIVSRAIWKFFYNRWYLNTALYWGAVIGPLALYRIVWRYFESTIIDGINPGLQGTMTYFSKVIKAGQTGIAQTYLFVFAAGMMIIIMLLLL
ncbi:MAG: NADH-quinone oxidoreductase subunit L [Nitrososphaeraceae archaeon]|nr:NADH-quinone oxidoreductase subunit L [Nitrososphaeraceae archaeon]MDW0271006.1 NADH-quinone oxidoreductase subunit L [Nitrososphaeraceae archaeon]MDW0293928.1 NADH-quinone oxidoreductase subunit L [Nitrososphaeraceae archaeon]MDW0296212.1 NADH-quinone oxidoreductase subunit L [Nitrososphaeraceae archaeon]